MKDVTLKVGFETNYDVVVVGGGTAGVIAAIAAARTGAKTALVEAKGYVGGTITEGGCGIHSFFNVWHKFPGVERKKVVRGLPEELFDRLYAIGGSSGHNDSVTSFNDSDSLFVDVEKYKYLAMIMLEEAGVDILVNTTYVDSIVEDGTIKAIVTISHQGTEVMHGKMFIDATAFGDLSARSGADYTIPNDHGVANSIGIAGIDIDEYYKMFAEKDCIQDLAFGYRNGRPNQVIRFAGDWKKFDPELAKELQQFGMSYVTVSSYDNYLMFLKINDGVKGDIVDRDALAKAELSMRKKQQGAINFLRKHIPNSENAFITRSSPSLNIRRGRCITCDYDLPNEEMINATHYNDDVFIHSFHDSGPKFLVKDGLHYGFPYRAILPTKNKNLFAVGMMITSDFWAHMSTRNTVSCMAQGQAAGTAAALCVRGGYDNTRTLPYKELRKKLEEDNVFFDN